MSTSKDLSSLVASLEAKALAKPTKAAIYQAKLDSKIASLIAKGKTVVIDGSNVTAYTLDTSGSGGSGGSSSGTTGTTYTLTTGVDRVPGTSNDDYIDGAQNASGTNTIGALDAITGGAGTDTLSVVVNGAAAIIPTSISGVEVINVTSTANGSGLSLASTTGASQANLIGSTATGVISEIGTTSIALGVKNTAQNATFTLTNSALSGSADSVTLNVENTSNGDVIVQGVSGTNGVETLAVVAGGSTASTLNSLTDGANNTSLKSVTVGGAQGLTITTNLVDTITTFNASANTSVAGVNVDFDAGSLTVTGGAGNDDFSFETNAGAVSAVGGAGNDVFRFDGTQTLTIADTVTGGDGTADKVVVVTADAQAIATALTKMSGIERVEISNAVGGATNYTYFGSGVNHLTFAAGVASATAQTVNTGSTTILLKGTANTTGMIVTADGSGTADAVTITFDDTTASLAAGADITGNGVETLTIDLNKAADSLTTGDIVLTGSGAASTTIKFTGGYGFTQTGAGELEAKTIDASGMSVAESVSGLVMSTAADTNISQTITGSGGLDTLVGGSGNDSINGGAGNDAITSGAGNDTIIGGNGNDTLTFGASLATGDSIDGGDGTDTISITTAAISVLNGYSISVAGALNDRISNVERLTVSDANTASLDLARVDSVNYVTLSAANTAGAVFSGFGANGTVVANAATNDFDVTLTTASGSADVFNISTSAAATRDFGTITVGTSTAVVETVNVTSTEGSTPDSTVRVHTVALDGAGTTKVVLAGTESITTTISSTAIATIDATGLTEGVANVTATAALGAILVTGSAQGDTFSTGSGADVLNGGAGDDNLTAGSGNDTIDGGAGNDTLVSGVGVDSLVGGDGTDTVSMTGWTIGTTTDGGSTAVQGTVVNLGTTAVTGTTINGYRGFGASTAGTTRDLNSDVTSIAADTTGLLGTAATVSARVDNISGFENVTGSGGYDYIVGSSGVNTINADDGGDVVLLGTGADIYVLAAGDSVVYTATSDANNAFAATETITFGNGVDVIASGFTAGAGGDVLDTGATAAAPTSGLAATLADNTDGVADTIYYLSGAYVASTGVFTIAANGAGADTLIWTNVNAANDTKATINTWVVLVGVDSDDLVAANFA